MKKTISVLAVTIILIAMIVWAQVVAENTLLDTTKKIDALYQSISLTENINNDQIVNQANELDKFWEKKERLLSLIMNHNDLNRIGEQIKKVVVYINQNDKKNCEYEIVTLQFYMQSYQIKKLKLLQLKKMLIEIQPRRL